MPVIFPIIVDDAEFIELCTNWHGGQTSAMYSVSSTGKVYSPDILFALVCELTHICAWCDNAGDEEQIALDKWEAIENQYILENSD